MAKYVVDVDTSDDFLDYPRIVYRQPDGSLKPPISPDEYDRLGQLTETKLTVPPSPDR